MEVPIRLEGRDAGRLTVRQEGAYTVFEGHSEDPGTLVRLSVYGGGREGVLGVMIPGAGGLTLTKRLSRSAMADFPETIEYAAPAGEGRREMRRENKAPQQSAAAPAPPAEPERGTELLWYRCGDGSLVTVWAGRKYRAVPLAACGLPEESMVEKRRIEGVEYAVYEMPEG